MKNIIRVEFPKTKRSTPEKTLYKLASNSKEPIPHICIEKLRIQYNREHVGDVRYFCFPQVVEVNTLKSIICKQQSRIIYRSAYVIQGGWRAIYRVIYQESKRKVTTVQAIQQNIIIICKKLNITSQSKINFNKSKSVFRTMNH